MVDAGSKYLAISFSSGVFGRTVIFRLMMPSKHFCPASNTPDPEFPVVATSLITVENLFWTLAGSNAGNITWERAMPSGTATMTGSPATVGFHTAGVRRIRI
jgi:hypothetical protein